MLIKDWVRKQKYRGIIGIDFIITKDQTPFYMEINARINGSTTGALLTDKLTGNTTNKPWAVQNNIFIPADKSLNDLICDLEKNKLQYHPDTQNGVLPTNNSAIKKHQKVMVLIMEKSAEKVKNILDQLAVLY